MPGARTPLIPVFEDNEGAISIASNPISNSNWNHIDVRHHSLQNMVEEKEIEVVHVPSAYQYADWFTKALPKEGFRVPPGHCHEYKVRIVFCVVFLFWVCLLCGGLIKHILMRTFKSYKIANE